METPDYVDKLNDLAQRRHWELKFEDVLLVDPDPINTFTKRARVNGQSYPNGVGKNKKEAKQMAAKNALEVLRGSSPESFQTEVARTKIPIFISILSNYCQKKGLLLDYAPPKGCSPSNNPPFSLKVVINKKDYPLAKGNTIKEAKQKAAQLAWSSLQEQSDFDSKVSFRSSVDSASNIDSQDVDLNGQVRPESTGDGAAFSDMVNPPTDLVQTPEVKPKIKIAENLLNACESKESPFKNNSPVEKTSPQPVSSRFLSEYDSFECLGKGGYGSVFKAKDKFEEKYYAVKITCLKEKALREVKALSDLNHENIVRYFACWPEDTGYQWDSSADSCSSSQSIDSSSPVRFLYIKMELCDPKTLRDWIDEKNTPNMRQTHRREESLGITLQLIAGVEYIHSKSLIHRDLKPSNILFGRDEKVKIGDFGLVTDESNDKENEMARTVSRGTPFYMAPEQRNTTIYDRKVDIYALGMIYFELLQSIVTGQERQAILDELRLQKLPNDFARHFQQEGLIIKSMLSELPQDRPEACQVKLKLNESTQLLEMIKSMRTI